jgi:hypothetical protein
MDKFIQNEWSSLKNELDENVGDICCSHKITCEAICKARLLKLEIDFFESYRKYYPKTELKAEIKYKECIEMICNKIKTCEDVKH